MKLRAAHALLPAGWARDVLIEIDSGGRIAKLVSETNKLVSDTNFQDAKQEIVSDTISGFVVPGMANVHSHAFQRAMAGAAEARTHPSDSFWTWRELMYRFAARLTPEQMQDVAAHLYVEMLKAGYTAVAEFHYLHHDVNGAAYEDPAEMSHRLIAAAMDAGMAITHLPVLYAFGGFGGKPPTGQQKRFVLTAEGYEALLSGLDDWYAETPQVRIGAAFHSLRAVDAALMRATLAALDGIDATAPIHIHVAEQRREVEECIAWSGKRPVQWLFDNVPVDERWCLVHATHVDGAELGRLAASGAIAGLCPTTEANLGDGVFPAADYLGSRAPGRFGIGSDSHIAVGVAEELRLLEYGQRLLSGRRSVLASDACASPGERLYREAAAGGARALGLRGGAIAAGQRADLVVLDPEHPALWNKSPAQALDAWIFAGDAGCVRDVMVGGEWRIRHRHHAAEEELAARFRTAQARLME